MNSEAPRTSPRRRLVAIVLAGVALVTLLLATAFGPQIARNLSTSVTAADETITLTSGDERVTLTAPAGWHVVRPVGRTDTVALETPDGRVEIALSIAKRGGPDGGGSGDAASGLPDAAAIAGQRVDVATDAWSTESPTSALTVTYAPTLDAAQLPATDEAAGGPFGLNLFADGSPGTIAMVASATPVPPSATGLSLDIVATSDVAFAPYLPEFARIVGSVVFS